MIPRFLRPEVLSYASVEIVRLPAPSANETARLELAREARIDPLFRVMLAETAFTKGAR